MKKREDEKKVVRKMIGIYCKGKHHTKGRDLCPDCQSLYEYAALRTDKCPFMETKTFCKNCKVHCYKVEMREKISEVMKYAGPRMIFHNPIMAIKHVTSVIKEKKRKGREDDKGKIKE